MSFLKKIFQKNKDDDLYPEFAEVASRRHSSIIASRRQSAIRETLTQIISDEDTIYPEQFSDDEESEPAESICGKNDSSYSPRHWTQIISLLPVYILQICYGMNSGYPAIATAQLLVPESCPGFQITKYQAGVIVSLDNAATPIVCILSGYLQHRYGPKRVLELACLPYIGGWLVAAFSTSAELLYVSRIIVGISAALLATTVYTVEIASKEMRGTFSIMEAVLRCSGCVIVYSLGYFFKWDDIAFFAVGVPILALVIAIVLSTESPVYLVSQNKIDDAKKALSHLYGPEYPVSVEVEIIRHHLEHHAKVSGTDKQQGWASTTLAHIRRLKNSPEVYKPFCIVLFLIFTQQFSGMSIVRANAVTIFDEVFQDDDADPTSCNASSDAYLSSIIIGIFRTISSLVLARSLRHYRRRFMYFVSAFATITALLGFATCDYLIDNENIYNNDKRIRDIIEWITLGTACCHVFAVQLGIQTLPFLLSGELFPSDIRAFCKSNSRSVACTLLIINLMLYPYLEDNINLSGTFYIYAGVITLCTPIVYFIMPETKDLSLDIVQNYFLSNQTRFYVDLISEESGNVSVKSTTSDKSSLSKGKAQRQLLDNIAEALSNNEVPDSGIYTINSDILPGNNICQTQSNQEESSQTLSENSSTNQDNHLNDNSNPSYSRASSPGRCSPKDNNNNSLRF